MFFAQTATLDGIAIELLVMIGEAVSVLCVLVEPCFGGIGGLGVVDAVEPVCVVDDMKARC